MNGLAKAKEIIEKSRVIAIAGHVNPDGDSIGSLLALGLGLERLGKKVYMVSRDGVPKKYRSLFGAGRIVKRIDSEFDLAISVDCSNKEILGGTYGLFRKAENLLEIDHHEFRRPFGNIEFVDVNAAAVGEMVYLLLKELNVAMTKDIAQSIMVSVIVETNSFRLPNVRPFTFDVCAKLIEAGADFYRLVERIFWSTTRASVILSGICLMRCAFMNSGRVVWSIVRRGDFKTVKGKDEDVDSVPDEMRSIKDVAIAVLFREKDKKTLRVSLRSKERINVGSVAEYYSGGGHFDVAGCNIPNTKNSMDEFLKRVGALVG